MLQLKEVHAHYGQSHVLHGVTLHVLPGEVVVLLGRNGSGRSTTAKAIMGLVEARGSITWAGSRLDGLPPHSRARLGLGYVPEHRDVFPRMSVEQNLRLGVKPGVRLDPARLDEMYTLFPALKLRRQVPAGALSGGEQQMLSLGRTLMGEPRMLVVDEPTEGLAPQVVEQVAGCLLSLRQRGLAILLAEQKLAMALQIADRVLVMGQGAVVFDGTPAGLRADEQVRRHWLEV